MFGNEEWTKVRRRREGEVGGTVDGRGWTTTKVVSLTISFSSSPLSQRTNASIVKRFEPRSLVLGLTTALDRVLLRHERAPSNAFCLNQYIGRKKQDERDKYRVYKKKC